MVFGYAMVIVVPYSYDSTSDTLDPWEVTLTRAPL